MNQTLRDARDLLARAGVEDPETSARRLYQFAFHISDTQMMSGDIAPQTRQQQDRFATMLARRVKREPVSRILGVRAFWNATFEISPDTLDPRPETETLLAAALAVARRNFDASQPLRIVDLGTGSGCILISLLQELPQATGIGIDISTSALGVARRNATALGQSARVQWIEGTWSAGVATMPDMIVSNPPYIRSGDIDKLASDVKDYDPRLALDGSEDGLECYRQIACAVSGSEFSGPLLLEVGQDQAADVRDIFATIGCHIFTDKKFETRDLSGIERVVIVNVR